VKNNQNKILENLNLLKKYDVHAFDYIEYPHKSFWKKKITDEDVIKNLEKICNNEEAIMLYIHIPFCEQLCMFCICHRQITKDYQVAIDYLNDSLFKEIELYKKISDKVGKKFNFKEVYFGGGSPTFLKEKEFSLLKKKLSTIANFETLSQFSVEIDPRRVDEKRLLFYANEGVDKISFGIQDFDPTVQDKINRVQPASIIKDLLTKNVREKFRSINFDLLIGLPGQTKKSISETIKETIDIRPDRIALAYLAYNPDYHPHQRHMMMKELLPDFYRRKELFIEALNILMESKYVRTGFEHFAVSNDDVSKSLEKRKAYYNSFGTTTGECKNILALGRSSYSTIGENIYFQNHYNQREYQSKLENGEIPIERGWVLNKDDIIRREVIKQIRTYFNIDFKNIFNQFNIDKDFFRKEFNILKEFQNDELLHIENDRLELTEEGKHFSNLVSSVFDTYVVSPRYNEEITSR
jgi:oxygen-independent coproporphyrinogen III oxidase